MAEKEAKDDRTINRAAKVGCCGMFTSGPYFASIPTRQESEAALKADPNGVYSDEYLNVIRKLAIDPVDTDEVYGVNITELVPLPFDAPRLLDYITDILAGVYLVAQASIVMYLGIALDNQERIFKLGNSYKSTIYPLIKALIIIYPLVTLVTMVTITIEYCLRKFMYYRLLSLRILVDWENKKVWKGVFFWYFIAMWVLMNAWCLYGVIKFWNDKNSYSAASTVQFSTFVVVNLQTIQILLYYNRTLASENRLVSLNQIFERRPVEAQRLLMYTYVVEEADLVKECYNYGSATSTALAKRLLNLVTCGMVYPQGWKKKRARAKFDIERLKRAALNYGEVQYNVQLVKMELEAHPEIVEALQKAEGSAPHVKDGDAAAPATDDVDGHDAVKAAGAAAAATVEASAVTLTVHEDSEQEVQQQQQQQQPGESASSSSDTGKEHSDDDEPAAPPQPPAPPAAPAPSPQPEISSESPTTATAGGLEAAAVASPASDGQLVPPRVETASREADPAAVAAAVAADAAAAGVAIPRTLSPLQSSLMQSMKREQPVPIEWRDTCCKSASCLRMGPWKWLYGKLYASIHCFFITFMPKYQTWPFRPDVPYIRLLTIIQLLGMLACCAVIVFGLLYSTNSTMCSKGNKTCGACYTFYQDHVVGAQDCTNPEFVITQNPEHIK